MDVRYKGSPTIVGIPRVHWNSNLGNFDSIYPIEFYKDIQVVANEILEDKNKYNNLILCGGPGSGKTHFLVGLYKSLAERLGYIHGDGVLFITLIDWMKEMISRFGVNASSMRELLNDYLSARYLFLDDVTATERLFKQDSMEFTVFRDTLIERWDNKKFVAFSSNFSKDELIKFINTSFGSYVSSRVLSSSKIIEFPSKDFRFKKNK